MKQMRFSLIIFSLLQVIQPKFSTAVMIHLKNVLKKLSLLVSWGSHALEVINVIKMAQQTSSVNALEEPTRLCLLSLTVTIVREVITARMREHIPQESVQLESIVLKSRLRSATVRRGLSTTDQEHLIFLIAKSVRRVMHVQVVKIDLRIETDVMKAFSAEKGRLIKRQRRMSLETDHVQQVS